MLCNLLVRRAASGPTEVTVAPGVDDEFGYIWFPQTERLTRFEFRDLQYELFVLGRLCCIRDVSCPLSEYLDYGLEEDLG